MRYVLMCIFAISLSASPALAARLFPPANLSNGEEACPSGQVLSWTGSGIHCEDPSKGVTTTTTCPNGQVMYGIKNGAPLCRGFQCRIAVSPVGTVGRVTTAKCNPDEILTGGGAATEVPGASNLCGGTKRGFIHHSLPSGNGWKIDSYDYNWQNDVCAQAYAVCCKFKDSEDLVSSDETPPDVSIPNQPTVSYCKGTGSISWSNQRLKSSDPVVTCSADYGKLKEGQTVKAQATVNEGYLYVSCKGGKILAGNRFCVSSDPLPPSEAEYCKGTGYIRWSNERLKASDPVVQCASNYGKLKEGQTVKAIASVNKGYLYVSCKGGKILAGDRSCYK